MKTLLTKTSDILAAVLANIEGRSADVSAEHYNTRLVASLAVMAGDGDTLEIGAYFGASAITTAVSKREHGVLGTVYALDPLDGREQMVANQPQTTGKMKDEVSGATLSRELFAENCKRNNADVILIAQPSDPFPAELADKRFTLTYIDGDHWHNTPLADWENVKNRTTRYVVFDDADSFHPHVLKAVEEAGRDGNWKMIIQHGTIAAFERKAQ